MLAAATLCLFLSQLIGLLKTSNPIPANCKVPQINSLRVIHISIPPISQGVPPVKSIHHFPAIEKFVQVFSVLPLSTEGYLIGKYAPASGTLTTNV